MSTKLHEPFNQYMCNVIVFRLAKLVFRSVILFCVDYLLRLLLVCLPDLHESHAKGDFYFDIIIIMRTV